MAIVGTHQPYAVIPPSAAADASQEAAVGSAAYRVLLGLFPARTAQYQAAYDGFIAAIADGPAKTKGIAIGAEAAAAILALRANDGRSVVLATYVPGTGPGQFRGLNPVNRNGPYIKPFALTSNAQFRAPGSAGAHERRVRRRLQRDPDAGVGDEHHPDGRPEPARAVRDLDAAAVLAGEPAHVRHHQPQPRRAGASDGDGLGRAERRRQRLLRIEVLLRAVASDFGDHARRHRRQRRDRCRRRVGPGHADAQPSRVPGRAQLRLGCRWRGFSPPTTERRTSRSISSARARQPGSRGTTRRCRP